MNLIKKAHSIWEGSSLTKKGKLCLTLTAIGIMGGFFVTQVWAVDTLSVTSPAANVVWAGKHDITWDKTKCVAGRNVDITFTTSTGNVAIVENTDCTTGKYEWDTAAMTTGANPTRIFPDGNGYNVFIYNTGTIFGTSGSFTIDNTKPTIAVGTISTPTVTLAGTVAQTINWTPGNIADNLGLATNSISLFYSLNAGATDESWTEIATGQLNGGSLPWTPSTINSPNVTIKIRAIDQAGNYSEQTSGVFAIDSTNPMVVTNGITVSKPIIKDEVGTDGSLTQTVTVAYNEAMKASVLPVISFVNGITAITPATAGTGEWSAGNTIWTQSFTFADANQEVSSVTVNVTGAKDAAGNVQNDATLANAFLIDTKNPTVVSATTTPNPAMTGNVNVTVVFSETMSVSPSVQITGISTTPIAVVGSSLSGATWTGSFVLGGDVDTTATISVVGGQDINGNIGGTDTTKTFEVDTIAPTVSSLSIDNNTLGENDSNLTVTVNYSEKMNESINPSISFSATAGILTAGTKGWSNGGMIWKGTFSISDANEEVSERIFTVSGAKDSAGNEQISKDSNTANPVVYFAVDTKKPTVVLTDTHADGVVLNADTFVITATFSENVIAPTIKIGDVDAVAMAGNANVWTFDWNVPEGNKNPAQVVISAKDGFGNNNEAATAGDGGVTSYVIDNTLPSVTVDSLITKITTPTITGTVEDGAAVVVMVKDASANVVATISGNSVFYGTTIQGGKRTWSVIPSALTAVTYDIVASATDVAGNIGVDSTSNELIIDTVPPTISGFTSSAATTVDTDGAVDLTFTAADSYLKSYTYTVDGAATSTSVVFDSSVTNSATVIVAVTGLSDGKHTVILTVTDKAGNISLPASTSFIVNINSTLTVAKSGAEFASIQTAISAATSGDTISVAAGLYEENLIIDKRLEIIGVGRGLDPASNTVIRKLAASPVVTLSASGSSTNEPILLQALRIEPVGAFGISVASGTVSFLELDNISVEGNIASYGENERGLNVEPTASLTNLVVKNSSFANCDHGWYFAKKFDGADESTVQNVTVSGTSFSNNGFKGLYLEKLSDATFTDVTVTANGSSSYWNSPWNAGFDINLKNGNYQNLTFSNLTVTGNGLGYKEGAGLLIKARNDATAYNTFPATLSGVTIDGGTFTGNERGIRFGEPNRGNSGPTTVVIKNANISGNIKTYTGTDGSEYGDLVNQSLSSVSAESNWWGTSVKSQIKTFGLVDFDPWYLDAGKTRLSDSGILTVDDDNASADFNSIQAAVDAAANNATINVAAGDYLESITIPATKTGLKILKDGSTGTATIKATTGDAITIPAGAINTQIKGFMIDCSGRDYGIKTTGATGVKIENNIISGYGKNGIIVNGGEVMIDGNTITGSTSSVFSVDSIYSTGATLTITNNTLKNNVYSPNITSTSAGISLHHNDNATITGNTIYGNSYGIHVKGSSPSEGVNPMLVTAHENKIYDNVTLNFFFEYRGAVPASNYDVSHNWWNSKIKSVVASKIATREDGKTELYATNYVNYSPWYLSGDSFIPSNLSDSDTIKPAVTLLTNDADSIVKAGDVVNITATITDANGIDGTPQITITNGQMADGATSTTTLTAPMTFVSENDWKFDWLVPAIDTSTGNVPAGIGVKAYDGVGNDIIQTTNLTIDNTLPIITIGTDDVSPIPVKSDSIILNISEATTESSYRFSTNDICGDADDYNENLGTLAAFVSGTAFSVAGNHRDYLCAIAKDAAGNIGSLKVGPFNTDNTIPSVPTVTITSPINFANQALVEITIAGEAGTVINWIINDSGSKSVAGTVAAVNNDGTVSDSPVDVSNLADGTLTLSATLIDAVLLTSPAGTATATKEATAPFVQSVSSTAVDGSYNQGDTINVIVNFSEAVTVASDVTLELETGDINRNISYASGSGTNALTFAYLIGANETSGDLDYTGTGALALVSGSVKDTSGNDAILTLPAPGAARSLGANKAIVIDTAAPTSSVVVPTEWKKTDVELTFTCSDGTVGSGCSKIYYTTNGSAPTIASSYVDVTTSWKKTFSDEGSFTILYMAQDFAGNLEIAKTADNLLNIDKTAPVTEVHAPVGPHNANANVLLSAHDMIGTVIGGSSVAKVYYCIDVANTCSPTVEYAIGLEIGTEGDSFVRYYSVDKAGNNETVKSVKVTIDRTAPAIIDARPIGTTSEINPTISATFTDASTIDISGVVVEVRDPSMNVIFDGSFFTITPSGITSNISTMHLEQNKTYKVVIIGLKDSLGNVTAEKSWSFGISNNAIELDTTAPTATASTPQDGAINVAVNASPIITFSEAIDEDTLVGNVELIPFGATEGLAATLSLSADKTKVTINPDVDLDNSAQYYFLVGVGVEDLAGNPISSAWSLGDKASHEFTTVAAHVSVTTKDITLKTGWNLVSLPLIPTSNKTVDILSAIISKVNIIQYYDGNGWTSYSPVAGTGNLSILEDGKGYWIDMRENITLTITGTEMPLPGSNMPLYQIKKGWNLIGFKSVSEMKSSAYLGGVSYVVVYSYDGTSNSYPTVAYPSSDPAQTTDNNMKPGLGYWLYAKEEGYIVPVIK